MGIPIASADQNLPEEKQMNKFVIIGGMGRSGTNLARRILGSHSKIAIPTGEFRFFGQCAKGYSVKEILSNPRVMSWGVDFSDLYEKSHHDVFVEVLSRYTRNMGKEIPGEKTPRNEFYYEAIKECLKSFDIKFVHLVRNPIDVIASFKHATFRESRGKINHLSALTSDWTRSASMGLARTHTDKDGYYVLKYEDLAGDPVGTARKLCTFVGVDFEEDRMLNLEDFAKHKDNTSFPQTEGNGHQSYPAIRGAESRKDYLTASEIQFISSQCGELANSLGYQDTDFKAFPPTSSKRDWKQTLGKLFGTRHAAGD